MFGFKRSFDAGARLTVNTNVSTNSHRQTHDRLVPSNRPLTGTDTGNIACFYILWVYVSVSQ